MINILVFIATIFLPGACILWLVHTDWLKGTGLRNSGSLWLAIPTSFALSISFISLLGWFFFFLQGSFQGVRTAFLVVTGFLILTSLVKLWKLKPPSDWINSLIPFRTRPLKNWEFYLGLFIVGVFSVALYGGAWFSHTADSLNHIAAVRSLIKFNNPLPEQIYWPVPVDGMDPTFGTWHLVLALFVSLSGMDITAMWLLATAISAPLIVWTLIVLALEITHDKFAALLTGLLYFLVVTSGDFRIAAYPNRMGQILFWLVFVYLLLAISAFTKQEKRSGFIYTTFSALFAWASSAIHQQYGPALIGIAFPALIVFILFTVVKRKVNNAKQDHTAGLSLKFICIASSAVLLSAALSLIVRASYTISEKWPIIDQTSPTIGSPNLPAQIVGHLSGWFTSFDSYITVASILSLLLIYFATRESGVNIRISYIFVSIILVPSYIVITSLFIGQGSLILSVLKRLELVVPSFLIIGWAWMISSLPRYVAGNYNHYQTPRFSGLIFAIAAIVFSLISIYKNINNPNGGLISIYSPSSDYKLRLAASRDFSLLVTRIKAIQFLKDIPEGEMTLAESAIGYEMAGLTGKTFISYPSQHTPLQEKKLNNASYEDVQNFMSGALNNEQMVEVLLRQGVSYVYVDRERYNGPHIWDRLDSIPILDVVAGSEDWRIYQVMTGKVEAYLDLEKRIRETNDFFEKIKLYKDLEGLFTDHDQYVGELLRELSIDPSFVVDFVNEGQYFSRPSEPGVTYDFLHNMDKATVVSNETNAVKRTVFIIKGDPKGVIFQHPTSALIYTVDIPHNSRLDFSIALDPIVWEYGKGDGVEYLISIEQGFRRNTVFRKYIDPKNISGDRRWLSYSIDLSTYGGKQVELIFKTQPGSQNDSRYDWAGWGEPRIRLNVLYDIIGDWGSLKIENDQYAEVKQVVLNLRNGKMKVLYQHPVSRVVKRVDLPENSELRFGVGMIPEAWDRGKSDGMEFKVFIQDPDNRHTLYLIFDRYLTPEDGVDQEWQDVVLDLSRFGGRRIDIIFETLPGPNNNYAYDWGGWSAPVIVEK